MPADPAPSRREFQMMLKLYAKDGGAVPPPVLQSGVDEGALKGGQRAADDAVIAQMALLALGDASVSAATKNVLCGIVDSGAGKP